MIKQRSDGKPERSTAKKFKTTMQIHGARPAPPCKHTVSDTAVCDPESMLVNACVLACHA